MGSMSFNNTTVMGRSQLALADKGTFFLVCAVVLILVQILGLIGNSLLVRVMIRSRSVNRSYGLFLITLAVTDSVNILLQMLDAIDEIWDYGHKKYVLHPNDIACKMHDYLSSVFKCFSGWLLVCITCERFLVVFYPLRGRMWWKEHRIKVFISIIFFFTLIQTPRLNFVRHAEQKGFCYFYIGNQTNGLLAVFFDSCVMFFFVYGVPSTILFLLNVLIILRMRGILKRSAAARMNEYKYRYALQIKNLGLQVVNYDSPTGTSLPSECQKTLSDRHRATCILVTISCTYFILLAPQSISRLYWAIVTSTGFISINFMKYYANYRFLFLIFTAMSYGSNFYTYFIFGKRFRAEVTRFIVSSSNDKSQHTLRPNPFVAKSPRNVVNGGHLENYPEPRYGEIPLLATTPARGFVS